METVLEPPDLKQKAGGVVVSENGVGEKDEEGEEEVEIGHDFFLERFRAEFKLNEKWLKKPPDYLFRQVLKEEDRGKQLDDELRKKVMTQGKIQKTFSYSMRNKSQEELELLKDTLELVNTDDEDLLDGMIDLNYSRDKARNVLSSLAKKLTLMTRSSGMRGVDKNKVRSYMADQGLEEVDFRKVSLREGIGEKLFERLNAEYGEVKKL